MNAQQEPDRATGIARAAGVALVQQRNANGYNQRFPDHASYLRYLQGRNYTQSRPRPRPAPTPTPTPTPPTPTPTIYRFPTGNNGVTTSLESPFGEGGNSYLFDPTVNSYLSVPPSDFWAFGTGDFTIEWFQKQTDTETGYSRIFSVGTLSDNSTSIACSIERDTSDEFYVWTGLPITNNIGVSVVPYKNAWHHFAIVRNAGQISAYKDGTLIGASEPNTTNITNTTSTLYFGIQSPGDSVTPFGGYLTNIRIVKGLAVYTGNFTVPTGELTVTAEANPYGGTNTQAIPDGVTKLLFVP